MTTRTARMMTARYQGRCDCRAQVAAGETILFAGRIMGCRNCRYGFNEFPVISATEVINGWSSCPEVSYPHFYQGEDALGDKPQCRSCASDQMGTEDIKSGLCYYCRTY